jgi:TonB family protein
VLSLISLALVLLATPAFQAQRRTCDHAAPPAGMHYVCDPRDSCSCHLEKDQPENDETAGDPSAIPAAQSCAASNLKYFVTPVYPAQSRRARKQGAVKAQLTVGPSGSAQIRIESGDPPFAKQVAEALKKWKFAPADPPQVLTVSITFTLAGNPSADAVTTVGGASPLELVITASPPLQ